MNVADSRLQVPGFRFRLFLALLLLAVLGACAPPRPAPPVEVLPGMEQLLLQRLDALAGTYDSLRGIAKVRVEAAGESFRTNQVLLVQRPDRLRAEALSPFGNPVLVAAANGADFSVLLPSEGRFLRGPASYRNVARFTRLPVQLSDLIGFLLYEVPVIPFSDAEVSAGKGGGYRLELTGTEEIRQVLEFDAALRLLAASYYQGDDPVLQVRYSQFTGPDEYPHSIFLATPGQGTEALLDFSEIAVNVPIPPERFTLAPPPGYAIEPLP